MADYFERMDIIVYMVENGYDLRGHTMDELAEAHTVSELWAMMQAFMGEEE